MASTAKRKPEGADAEDSVVTRALKAIGGALADHGHTWTAEQRRLYDAALREEERRASADAAGGERKACEQIAAYQWGSDAPAGHPLVRIIRDMQRIAKDALKT